jgi:hypothetical protein
VFLTFRFEEPKRISFSKSQFLREEHARLGQEALAQRRVEELTRELEAAQGSTLHEHERATAAEQGLTMAWSALSVEREARALAEGQAQSRGQHVAELEVTLT